MTASADLAYALARLQARLGARATDADWQALDATHTAAHALEVARNGPMATWAGDLASAEDAAVVEARLRQRWDREVDRVARWLPERWRAAVRQLGQLAPWPPTPSIDGQDNADAPDAPLDAWAAAWSRALPVHADPTVPWRTPAELLCPRLSGADAGRPARPADVERRLVALFRRHGGTALPALAYLALAALDLERLRGALVSRSMFEAEARAA